MSVAFAPDGATIATTGVDGTARIWDTRTGAELRHLTGHTDWVWSVAFAPDGATIATASYGRHGPDLGHPHRGGAAPAHRPHRPGAVGGLRPG